MKLKIGFTHKSVSLIKEVIAGQELLCNSIFGALRRSVTSRYKLHGSN